MLTTKYNSGEPTGFRNSHSFSNGASTEYKTDFLLLSIEAFFFNISQTAKANGRDNMRGKHKELPQQITQSQILQVTSAQRNVTLLRPFMSMVRGTCSAIP